MGSGWKSDVDPATCDTYYWESSKDPLQPGVTTWDHPSGHGYKLAAYVEQDCSSRALTPVHTELLAQATSQSPTGTTPGTLIRPSCPGPSDQASVNRGVC